MSASPSAIELVMLDCDGVIIDSEYLATLVESERYTAWGHAISPEDVSRRYAGLAEEEIARRVEAETERTLPPNWAADMKTAVVERIAAECELIEGAHAMIAALPHPVCVCSNSAMDTLRRTLGRVGLWDTLGPHTYSARDLGVERMKPEPDVYLTAARAFGIDPRRAVVVEDSVHGVAGGVAAGARVIGFTGGRHTYPGHGEALSDAGATTVVSRHADVLRTIAALNEWDERTFVR